MNEALAASTGVEPDQVILGAGSTEVLHCALHAFTAADRPLITAWPTWEMARDVVQAMGRPVVRVPLTPQWSADVERMAYEAKKAGGGVIHLVRILDLHESALVPYCTLARDNGL